MPTSSTFAQKLNCIWFSYIYVLNYHLRKLYLLIIHLPFSTFRRWWWMWWWPCSQWLNIQYSSLYSFQLFFYFYSSQSFRFFLLPLSKRWGYCLRYRENALGIAKSWTSWIMLCYLIDTLIKILWHVWNYGLDLEFTISSLELEFKGKFWFFQI